MSSLTKIEKRYEELLEELSEEQKKLKKINKKIEKHEIIGRINIKEIESEILDETKALEEIKTKLKKLETKVMKKRFQNEIDEQETLERQKIKIETEELKKVNKIGGHKIRTESIKDTTKRETEELRIKRINKLTKTEKIKTVIRELRIEIIFHKLANNSDIRLLKGSKKSIPNIAAYISNGKNLKIKPNDSSFKNKRIAYCTELPFGIISSSNYVNIETMNIISSDVEMNKVLASNPSNLFYCCLNN